MVNGPLWMKLTALLTALFVSFFITPLFAQNPYSAAVTVNGNSVTYFEIDQRTLMMEILGSAGDLEEIALNDLINDRLRQFAGKQLGLSTQEEELTAGITEFSQRVNLKPKEFLAALEKEGLARETFLDFVSNRLIWRKVVQQKFQSKAFITEVELDTAMALGTTAIGTSVLLSELVLPFQPATEAQAVELIDYLSTSINDFKSFEEAALTYSAAPSRANGGKLDWSPVSNLPPEIQDSIMTMNVGQVTTPMRMPQAYVIFQVRGIRDNRTVAAKPIAYDYATLLLPGGRSEQTLATAAKLRGSIDTCKDLEAKASGYPEKHYSQQVIAVGKVIHEIGGELANLDANEVSTKLVRGENGEFLMFLMLCARTNSLSEGNREEVRIALFNQRMEAFGEGYLQELKGDAIIIYK